MDASPRTVSGVLTQKQHVNSSFSPPPATTSPTSLTETDQLIMSSVHKMAEQLKEDIDRDKQIANLNASAQKHEESANAHRQAAQDAFQKAQEAQTRVKAGEAQLDANAVKRAEIEAKLAAVRAKKAAAAAAASAQQAGQN